MPSDTSIRERILLAVRSAVRPAAEGLGATLHRSPTVAIGREHCPALVVFPESEAITERANDCVTRELTVRLVALARAVPPTAPESEADRLLTAAHRALMADMNLGGTRSGYPRAGLRVGGRGRRCRRGRHSGALPHHLPHPRQRSFHPRISPMTHVRLTRLHTHAGLAYAPGERLEVDAATAEWLIANDVASPDAKPDTKTAKTDPEPKPQPVKEPKP